MNRFLTTFMGLNFNYIFESFLGASNFTMSLGYVWYVIVAQGPILYIYSLGHFLTTKGALIDGDWGGSKTDQKMT